MEYPIRFVKELEGYSLFHTQEIDSTNSYFKREFSYFKDKSLLVADHQTSGRGRFIRKWEDDEKDLIFSLLRKNSLRYEILMPLSILNVTRRHQIPSFIKWPNDIYVEGKKLSGILIEDIFDGSSLLCQVIGVGINFLEKPSLNAIGISSFIDIDKDTLLEEILLELSLLETKPFEETLLEYTKNNLIYHRHILFHSKELVVEGFTKEGHLLCRDKDENEIIIRSDEINIKDRLKNE